MFGEVFCRTDILEKHGIKGKIMFFEHGSDQAKACKEGMVDVTFSCNVPAILHLVRCPDLCIIGTPGELGRIAMVVPEQSNIFNMEQLRDKNILIHDGSSAAMVVSGWLSDSGINPQDDVTIRYADIDEIKERISEGGAEAAVLWDPWLEVFLDTHNLRIARETTFSSVIVASERFLQGSPDLVIRYKAALEEAFCWASNNSNIVGGWVSKRSGIDKDAVERVLESNQNWITCKDKSRSMDFKLTPHVVKSLKASADFLLRKGDITEDFKLEERIDPIFSSD